MLIYVKMPTIVGILKFMSRINFVLSYVEHGKKFYNLGTRDLAVCSMDSTGLTVSTDRRLSD